MSSIFKIDNIENVSSQGVPLTIFVVEIYSRLHGSEKKIKQYDDYGM